MAIVTVKLMFVAIITTIEKSTHLAKITSLVLVFLSPLNYVVGLMILFLLANTASGVYLSYKKVKKRVALCPNERKMLTRFNWLRIFLLSVDKDKFWKTIEKLITYPIIITGFFIFDVGVLRIEPTADGLLHQFSFTNLAFVMICFYDMLSAIHNMGQATDHKIYKKLEKLLISKTKEKYDLEID